MSAVFRAFVEKLGGSEATTFIGNRGELFYDPNTSTLRVSDGSTPGGIVVNGGGGTTYTNSDAATYLNGNLDTHIIPDTNAAYDLGNAEYKIRHLFLSDNTLYYEGDFLKVAQHNAGANAEPPSYMIPLAKLKEALNASVDFEAFKAAILAIGDAS